MSSILIKNIKSLVQTSSVDKNEKTSLRPEQGEAMSNLTILQNTWLSLQEDEIKMLRVIQRLNGMTGLAIETSFLGTHAIPTIYKNNQEAYLNLRIEEMLPRIAVDDPADHLDLFCEKKLYAVAKTGKIILITSKSPLKAKTHSKQFKCMGGIRVAAKNKTISIDHLGVLKDEEMTCLN